MDGWMDGLLLSLDHATYSVTVSGPHILNVFVSLNFTRHTRLWRLRLIDFRLSIDIVAATNVCEFANVDFENWEYCDLKDVGFDLNVLNC